MCSFFNLFLQNDQQNLVIGSEQLSFINLRSPGLCGDINVFQIFIPGIDDIVFGKWRAEGDLTVCDVKAPPVGKLQASPALQHDDHLLIAFGVVTAHRLLRGQRHHAGMKHHRVLLAIEEALVLSRIGIESDHLRLRVLFLFIRHLSERGVKNHQLQNNH
jgi:hypothetical protein